MADNKILGKNMFFEIKIDGDWYPVFCAKTVELSTTLEEIETTSVNSGVDREFAPGMGSAEVVCTGLTTSDNTNGRVSIIYLTQQANRRRIWESRVRSADNNGNATVISFLAFTRDTGWSRAMGSFSQSSATFRVTGGLDYATVVPAPVTPVCEVQDTLYLTLATSSTSVQDDLLKQAGVEVLWVTRSGMTMTYKSSGSPSAGTLEFTVNYTDGEIFFDSGNPGNDPGEPVSIGYKITPP